MIFSLIRVRFLEVLKNGFKYNKDNDNKQTIYAKNTIIYNGMHEQLSLCFEERLELIKVSLSKKATPGLRAAFSTLNDKFLFLRKYHLIVSAQMHEGKQTEQTIIVGIKIPVIVRYMLRIPQLINKLPALFMRTH